VIILTFTLQKIYAFLPILILWPAIAFACFYVRPARAYICAVAAAIVAMTVYTIAAFPLILNHDFEVKFGGPTPELALTDLQGREFDWKLRQQDRVVVLDFFGTWCTACIQELPHLEQIKRELQGHQEIEWVLVVTGAYGDTRDSLREYFEQHPTTLRVAFDPTEGALKKKFDTVGFPTLVVIDKANSVRYLHRGYNAADTMFRQHLVSALTSPYQ